MLIIIVLDDYLAVSQALNLDGYLAVTVCIVVYGAILFVAFTVDKLADTHVCRLAFINWADSLDSHDEYNERYDQNNRRIAPFDFFHDC